VDEAQSQPAAGESDGQANNETDCNSQRKYRPPQRMDQRAFGGKQSSGSHDGTLEPSVMAMRPDPNCQWRLWADRGIGHPGLGE
jgi:hypothetical protein